MDLPWQPFGEEEPLILGAGGLGLDHLGYLSTQDMRVFMMVYVYIVDSSGGIGVFLRFPNGADLPQY